MSLSQKEKLRLPLKVNIKNWMITLRLECLSEIKRALAL